MPNTRFGYILQGRDWVSKGEKPNPPKLWKLYTAHTQHLKSSQSSLTGIYDFYSRDMDVRGEQNSPNQPTIKVLHFVRLCIKYHPPSILPSKQIHYGSTRELNFGEYDWPLGCG